jgi:glycerol kinase
MLFQSDGTCIGTSQRPLTQYYPAPGLVEHDAAEIWTLTLACAREMVAAAGGGDRIACIGITNQRETIIFWDRRTGEPLSRAIVWQDRRTAGICAELKAAGHEPVVQVKTGLLLDPYFSGSKIGWALDNWPQLRDAGGNLAVGTVESYLLYRLSGGAHLTDATNASRTALMSIGSSGWDDGLLDLFGVPKALLAEIVDCAGPFASTLPEMFGAAIPVTGMAGDQQAATIGQGCFSAGQAKSTYGTGAFVLANTGTTLPHSRNRLLSTVLWQLDGERTYALEGSVFVAGSLIKWLRDELGLMDDATQSEELARSVPDNGGVYLVPALSGLGAPHWEPNARGLIDGLSFATGKAHIVRAGLEAMAHQTHDLKAAFAADGADWGELRIDGGMVANNWMAQDLSDLLDIPVERPHFVETTALGAAMLAALGAGMIDRLEDAAAMRGPVDCFLPNMTSAARSRRLCGWAVAMARVLSSK